MLFPRIAAPALALLLLAAPFSQAQLDSPTRQPDAYNNWKLALAGGVATDPATLTVPPGFKVELLRSATPEEDSWVSMAFDPQGRLTVAREKRGLLRLTIGSSVVEKVEVIDDTLLECRGLLYADGVLYANANNSKALVRLGDTTESRTTDGTDDTDRKKAPASPPSVSSVVSPSAKSPVTELLRTDGGVGHGRNHVLAGPDGALHLVHGNNVVLPAAIAADSPLRDFRDDRLIPCPWDPQMFDGDVKLPAGHILRADRELKTWTLVAGGLRNPLDAAFNEDGEMFTFDADMEWDTGTPWYRPCRVNHVVSGADFGWRRGTSKWPGYFPDCGPTVLDIGLASPTGIEFGTRSHFPPAWRGALFISDWSYGRIIAVHLTPHGASYSATAENFVVGKPLNVTDVTFGPDGAMYFITGGRRTQSGLYRVSYVGPKVEPVAKPNDSAAAAARALRRKLEALHGHPTPGAVATIWPHLASDDPCIRHAARIALEWQDVAEWKERALAEQDITASLTALMALARRGASDVQVAMLDRLNALPFAKLTVEQQILAARDYQLAFIRLGRTDGEVTEGVTLRLDALYPAADWRVNHLLCELLAYLRAPTFRDKTVALLAAATRSEDLLHYLFHLRLVPDGWSIEQRRTAFAALNCAETLEGARDYQRSLKLIRGEMLETLTPAEHDAVAPLLAEAAQSGQPASSGPQTVVREWKAEELLATIDRVGRGRSFEGGRQAFATAQCVLCHRLGAKGGLVGPDLTAVGSRFNRRDLLDSIVNPSRVIDDKFRNVLFTLKSGATASGTIERENEESVTFRTNPLAPETTTLPQSAIASRAPSAVSPMPPGLLNVLSQNQILDLLAYLESGGDPRHADFAP